MLKATQGKVVIAMVTAPDRKTARTLARAALQTKLTACANLVPGVESLFWWEGKLTEGKEVLIIFKTTRPLLSKLERLIVEKHPYDTPEFIVLPVNAGNQRYLDWCKESVRK